MDRFRYDSYIGRGAPSEYEKGRYLPIKKRNTITVFSLARTADTQSIAVDWPCCFTQRPFQVNASGSIIKIGQYKISQINLHVRRVNDLFIFKT